MLTAYDLVWFAAERAPDHLALVDDATDRRLTHGELRTEIDTIAAGFAARGIKSGTRVATVLPSLYDHGLALLALQRLGAVPALLNFRLTPKELATLIDQGGIEAAIIGNDGAVASEVKAALPDGAMLLAVGGSPDGAEDFAACCADPSTLGPAPRPDPEDPAFIFYTSGTTGLPKGVVLSHRTTEHRVLWISTQAGMRHGTHNRTLGFMPLSHAIGFYGVFLITLAYDGTYYCMSSFNPKQAVDMIDTHEITYLFGVPTLFHAIVNAPNYEPARMKSLDLALFGGGAMPGDLLDQMDREWNAAFRHIYGTTELMCSLYNPEPVGQPATLRPGFYSRTRIVEVGGGPEDVVAPGEEGELIADATVDTTFTEYLNRPDVTAEKVRDGWYFTGDVCLLHDNGDVDLVGRVDDMIRSGGENIHPEEVETVIAGHPGVKEVSVIGIPDDRWGQIVTACVVTAEGAPAEDLDAHCRASALAGFKRPKAYVFVDALPRNAANKVLRRLLRETAMAARDGSNAPEFHAVSRG